MSKRIKLSKKQTLAWKYLEDNETTEIGYGGAAGGGKSWLGCIWHIYRRTTYPNSRGLIGRAELSALKESTLITFFKTCADMGYRAGIDFKYNGQDHTVTWKNDSKTVFKDLKYYPSDPDFTSLGSTEYTDAFIDEATEITQKAFEIVNSRLRWKIAEFGLKPKTLITCNPGPGWVKERFVLDKNAKPVILAPYQKFVQALPTDNPDEAFRQLYIEQLNKMTSDYDKQRLLYGDWEAEREVLSPFAHQYNASKHESRAAIFRPDKQILIKIDFNLTPFAVNFSHMWRDSEGEHYHTFDEAEIKHGSIPAMIELLKAKYGAYLHNCIITGDHWGTAKQLSQKDNASYYLQIKRALRLSDTQLRVKPNPQHDNSSSDVNYVLANFPDYKINPETCPNTCRDMRTVQCDAFGEILKRNRNDLTQRADYLDCFTGDTEITTIDGQKPIESIDIGDYVLTKNGYKKVIDNWSSTAEVYEFTFSNGEKIKCTKDHKFYAHNYGWCEIIKIFTEGKSILRLFSRIDQHQILTVTGVRKMGVQKVYDITVEDEHCFYANNILVHNCERYGINTFLRKWIDIHQKTGR